MTPYLLTYSLNIKNLYKASYDVFNNLLENKNLSNNINFFITDLEEYKKELMPWKNTKEQINIMKCYNKK